MFKVNRKIEYALIALKYMSAKNPGQLTTAKEICAETHTPFDPTARVLQIMTQNGILHADHGARGGYQIIKDLSKISLLELNNMLIGPIGIANCLQGEHTECSITPNCELISPMLRLNDHLNEFFSKIMVTQLLESKHHREKLIKNMELLQKNN